MGGEGDVLEHHQQVGHCDPRQDQVDRVPPHVPASNHSNKPFASSIDFNPTKGDKEPVCEDKDVDDVEDDADDADGEGEVAMHRLIQLLHRFSSLILSNPRFV